MSQVEIKYYKSTYVYWSTCPKNKRRIRISPYPPLLFKKRLMKTRLSGGSCFLQQKTTKSKYIGQNPAYLLFFLHVYTLIFLPTRSTGTPIATPLQLGIKSHMQSLDQFVFQVAAAEDDQPQKCDDAQNQADGPGDAVGVQLTVVINAEEQ